MRGRISRTTGSSTSSIAGSRCIASRRGRGPRAPAGVTRSSRRRAPMPRSLRSTRQPRWCWSSTCCRDEGRAPVRGGDAHRHGARRQPAAVQRRRDRGPPRRRSRRGRARRARDAARAAARTRPREAGRPRHDRLRRPHRRLVRAHPAGRDPRRARRARQCRCLTLARHAGVRQRAPPDVPPRRAHASPRRRAGPGVRSAARVSRRRGSRPDRGPRGDGRARLSGRGEPARHRRRSHRVREHELHPWLHGGLEVGVHRALHVELDPRDAQPRRDVDVARPQSHARGARRDGPPPRSASRTADLQDRHGAGRPAPRLARVRRRRRRDPARGARRPGAAVSVAARGGDGARRHPRLRRAGLEPLRDLGVAESDPDAGLDGPRLSRRHDRRRASRAAR